MTALKLSPDIIVRQAQRVDGYVVIRNLDMDDEEMGLCLIPHSQIPALIAALAAYEEMK